MVPMLNRVRALLEHHFALEKAFPVKTRRAQDIVKAVADRAGITRDVSPYVLRHTFATTALQKEISLAAVQKIRPSRSRGPGRSSWKKSASLRWNDRRPLGMTLTLLHSPAEVVIISPPFTHMSRETAWTAPPTTSGQGTFTYSKAEFIHDRDE